MEAHSAHLAGAFDFCDSRYLHRFSHVTGSAGVTSVSTTAYKPSLGREWVILLGFPPDMYPSSNWGGYLRCSHR